MELNRRSPVKRADPSSVRVTERICTVISRIRQLEPHYGKYNLQSRPIEVTVGKDVSNWE